MECPDCHGNDDECLRCEGIGTLCDVCGEASDDYALDTCLACQEDEEQGD